MRCDMIPLHDYGVWFIAVQRAGGCVLEVVLMVARARICKRLYYY